MNTYTLRVPRWTRPTGDRNPLQAAGDRIAVVLALVVTLLAVPVATDVGTAEHDANREPYAQQATTRQNITETVSEGSVAPESNGAGPQPNGQAPSGRHHAHSR